MMSNDILDIRTIRLEEIGIVVSLLDLIFGPRQGTLSVFQKWIDDPSYSVLGAIDGSDLIGISVARWQEDDGWAQSFSLPEEVLKPYLGRRKIGTFQIMAVPPEHRRKGIAEKLSLAQLSWMKLQKCDGAIGTAWQHGTADNSEHLFRKGGFKHLGNLPGFYLEGSRKTQHQCPICQGECHCLAKLYAILF